MGLLRFLLATSVMSAHFGSIFGLTFVGGKIAVQTFFIISGFYMALILEKKYTGENSYKLFITNRFLRIYPAYILVLCLSIIFFFFLFQTKDIGPFSLYARYFSHMNIWVQGYLLLSQAVIFGLDWVMFLGVHLSDGSAFFTTNYLTTKPLLYDFLLIPQAWTLSLELLFYLVIPFIYRRNGLLIFLVVLSILLRFVLYHVGLHQEPWTNRFFPTEFAFFLLGVLLFKIAKYLPIKNIPGRYIIFYFLIFIGFLCFYEKIPYFSFVIDIKQAVFFLLFILGLPFFFNLTNTNYLDHILGELSYPMYISHIVVFALVQTITPVQWIATAAFFTTVALSYSIYYFVDEPINLYRQYRVNMIKSKNS